MLDNPKMVMQFTSSVFPNLYILVTIFARFCWLNQTLYKFTSDFQKYGP